MNKIIEYMTSISILIALIVGIIGTIVVIIDCHKQWKLIEKEFKNKEK